MRRFVLPSVVLAWSLLAYLGTPVTAPARPGDTQPGANNPDSDPLPPGALARFGMERLQHGSPVKALAFSRDGKLVISGGKDGVRLWDAATGKEVRRLGSWVQATAVSPDGALVAAACKDGPAPPSRPRDKEETIHLWETTTGKALPSPPASGLPVGPLAFSPDGKLLAFGDQSSSIHLWELAKGKEVRQLKGQPKDPVFSSLAFSPDGESLLSCAGSKTLILWRVATGEATRRSTMKTYVVTLTFSPGGDTFATAEEGGLVNLWQTATGELVRRFEGHRGYVMAVAFSADGRTLVSGDSDKTVRLWDVSSGRELRQLTGHRSQVAAVAFSADGKTVASGGWDQRVRLWDVATGKERHAAEGPQGLIWAVAFSPDTQTLASGAYDGICLWDVTTHKLLRRLDSPTGITSLAFSPDGKLLAATGGDAARLWDLATGKELRHVTATGYPARFACLAFSPDGKLLATGSGSQDQTVELWDVATGKQVRVFRNQGKPYSPQRVLFSADGETLIAASFGGTIRAWSIETGTERRPVESSGSFQLYSEVSPDGRNLAGQDADGNVYVWELATGKERARFPQKEAVLSFAFSLDGQHLIGALASNSLRVWDLATGQEAGQLPGHSSPARSLACSPDGKLLASGGSQGAILLWDMSRLPATKRPPARELSPAALDVEWQALGGEDATRAYRALWTLRAVPQQALPLLQADLRPAAAVDPERITKLLADLDSGEFAVRDKATADLEKLGEAAVPRLVKALKSGNLSGEASRRVQGLLDKSQAFPPGGDRIRTLRMLELLERLGTPEAAALLKSLAINESDPRLAHEAKAAQERLSRRSPDRP
jgi:WD40 repeat protein